MTVALGVGAVCAQSTGGEDVALEVRIRGYSGQRAFGVPHRRVVGAETEAVMLGCPVDPGKTHRRDVLLPTTRRVDEARWENGAVFAAGHIVAYGIIDHRRDGGTELIDGWCRSAHDVTVHLPITTR